MSNLSIKDVFKARVEFTRQCSARHHRSFQGELMTLIEPDGSNAGGAFDPSGHSR